MLSMGSATAPAMADLVILGQYQGPQLAHPLPIAHSVVSRCGRSVLVVPATNGPISFARAAIARMAAAKPSGPHMTPSRCLRCRSRLKS
jgi:hypothetical protein